MEALPQDLADFLVTRNFDPEYFDAQGQPSEAGDAKTMKFDYVSSSGKNYGTAVIIVADDELSLFYGDNLGRGMEPEDKDEWYTFLEELSNKAASHSATWSPRDINQLKHTLAGIAAIKEGLFEGYYGNRRVSYMGEQTQARLVINHNRVLGENDKRFRYVESLFIETADQERFRLPFKSLAGGRAMLEHVRSGGRPYDVRGNHITEVVSEMAVLSRFNRAQHHRVYEGVTQELVESAQQYYRNLQETVKHLGSPRGYQAYFESWAPDQTGEAEALVENLRDLFVEQTLDARIEAALPTLAKIQQQGNNMKEAQIFENWINNLSEGTWALPETPEQMEKLNQLMSSELIVGPDATNATEQLYDIVGDDELFDILNDLADRSEGRANCWDDSDVQRRLAELGIQTPQSTQAEPADVEQDTAPAVKEAAGAIDYEKVLEAIAALYGDDMWDNDAMGDLAQDLEQAGPTDRELDFIIAKGKLPTRLKGIRFTNTDDVQFGHMDEGDNQSTFVEELDEAPYDGPYDKPIRFQPGDSQAYRDAMTQGRGIRIQNRADAAEKTLAQRAAEPKNIGQKIARDIGNPLKQLAKGDVKGALFDPPASLTNKVGSGSYTSRMTGGGGMGGGAGLGGGGKDPMNRSINPLKLENAELAEMLKYAGVPIREGVLNDSTGSTMDHIQDRFRRDIKDFTETGDMSDDLYDALYDYYFDDMPYGTKKARTGDPHEWVADRFASDLGINENLITPMIMPVSEGSCNMTMEGSYCPEHGLAECGGMYEDSRSRTVPPRPSRQNPVPPRPSRPSRPGQNLDTPRTKSYAFGGTLPAVNVTATVPKYNPDEPFRVDVRGFGPDFEDLPAGKKLINPIQPRKHNELSPLKSGDSAPLSKIANVDLTMDEDGGAVGMPYSMGEGVYDPDYRGGYNNEFDELEDLLSKSGMSQDDLMRQRFLASKHGLNTPADMSKLPALKKDAETGYVARKAALDADLEKRNQQYLQDKLTDLEYQQDPVAFVKRRTQQLSPTAPTAPTAPPFSDIEDRQADTQRSQSANFGTDYSLPRAKLGSSPSAKFPNFRPEPAAQVPAPSDQIDTRNQKPSIFQQLAQLRNRTRGTMAETSHDDPINSNSAMTGSYYEGKETDIQEGDALLARIKSLALLR